MTLPRLKMSLSYIRLDSASHKKEIKIKDFLVRFLLVLELQYEFLKSTARYKLPLFYFEKLLQVRFNSL